MNSFTWSKAIDNAPGHLENYDGDNSRVNYYNLPLDKGFRVTTSRSTIR